MEETIGQRIKRLREEKGLSQIALAEELGLKTKGAINKMENGTTKDIKQTHIIRLCEVLNVSKRYLVFGTNEISEGDLKLHEKEFNEMLEKKYGETVFGLLGLYEKLDDDTKRKVNTYAYDQYLINVKTK